MADISSNLPLKGVNLHSVCESIPGIYLVLAPDLPRFTILAVSNDLVALRELNKEEIVGRPLFEVFPLNPSDPQADGALNLAASLEKVIREKKPHRMAMQRYDVLKPDGSFEERYWEPNNRPILNESGEVEYIINSSIEVTEKFKSDRREGEIKPIQKSYDLFMQAPMMIGIIKGKDFIIDMANQGLLQLWNKGPEITGRPLFEAVPELKGQGFRELLEQVMRTGEPYYATESPATLIRNGREEDFYFNFTYQPFTDDQNEVGVFATATDVTEQVLSRKKLEQSEQRARNILDQAPDPILILKGKDMVLEVANEPLLNVWGVGREAIGKPFLEILPEMKDQPFIDLLRDVYYHGTTHHGHEVPAVFNRPNNKKETLYFNFSYQPYREKTGEITGVLVLATDVTRHVAAKRTIEENEKNFRNMILQSPVAMCILQGPTHIVQVANEKMFEVWGRSAWEVMGLSIFEGLPEARNQGFESLLHKVYTTGETYKATGVPVVLPRNGNPEVVYLDFVYAPLREGDGSISGIMAVAIEVTEQVTSIKQIEESREELNLAVEIAELGTFRIDIERNTGYFSERIRNWFGFDQLHEDLDAVFNAIEDSDREEVVQAIRSSINGVNNGKHDVTYRVINSKDGVERFLRSFGKVIFNESGKAQFITGLIQEVTKQVLHLMQMEEVEAHLQQRVSERTLELENLNMELKRSNANLEEFAYAASHDMKEPIRKIHFFSDLLKQRLEGKLDADDKRMFGRMEQAALRMKTLIDDLLLYSHITKGADHTEPVDLNDIVNLALEDLELEVEEKNGKITVEHLPSIHGHKRQLQQLFQNLIGNGLKYSRPDLPPHIHVSCKVFSGKDLSEDIPAAEAGKKYYLIEVEDNGIGFEQKDADRIFHVFQRLHGNAEYKGSGIGLSIVQKVAENHKGFVFAKGAPEKGASFFVALPAEA